MTAQSILLLLDPDECPLLLAAAGGF